MQLNPWKYWGMLTLIVLFVCLATMIPAFAQGNDVLDTVPCEVTIEPGYSVQVYNSDGTTVLTKYFLGTVKRGIDTTDVTFVVRNTGSEPVTIRPQINGSACLTAGFDPNTATLEAGESQSFQMAIAYGTNCELGQMQFDIEIVRLLSP